jgi:hypothetical protein
MEMTNENGNHNDLPSNDPAFEWAWEIYKEADHLVHSRTTFFFAAQSFLVVAWKEYAEPRWLPARIIFGTVIPVCLLLVWTGFGITTLLISRLPS